ncbi:hypothetical protein [Runella zeae]|uniref:hypothetical protein n=1 Tax=Runella zeae TaxID=94255 RepID=UPI002357E1F9|nr:hypothetical protein [Runella zeae]
MKDLHKILTALNLSSSDTREDTIISIIKTTLFESDKPVDFKELIENIDLIYDVELYDAELKECLKKLFNENIILFEHNQYSLTVNEKSKFKALNANLSIDENKRFESFKNLIEVKLKYKLEQEDLKKLWSTFNKYLYSCFYYYGIKAIEYFHPAGESKNISSNAQLFNEALNDLQNQHLSIIFKLLIDNFAEYASENDINFINDLGQKTLAFVSLGLSPDDAKENFDSAIIDWILYLDTNFLFSILDLHINPETESCKELLKLVLENKEYIKIKFRYSDLTHKELRDKKKDFENIDSSLTKSAIRALLKSEDLDDFSRQYYTNLLTNPDQTLHPNEIIDLSDRVLPKKHIEISRSKTRLEHLGEKYINLKIQDYQRYIDDLNEIREQFAQEKGNKVPRERYRSDKQKEHDISLRELILDSRSSLKGKNPNTFNEVKYYGVTLDDLLIKYDIYEIRKAGISKYPTFFKPSFLLNQLVKILPIKTNNYKKAFIKAVSAKGFNKDIKQSNDIIKVVSYLKKQGIDNEAVLLNLISEKLFMDSFREQSSKDNFIPEAFFESELNKLYEKSIEEISSYKTEIIKSNLEKSKTVEENEKLVEEKSEKENEAALYRSAMIKLQKQVNTLTKNTKTIKNQINIFEELDKEKKEKEKISEIESLKKAKIEAENKLFEKEKKDFYKQELFKWRRSTWVWFSIFICLILFVLFILFKNNNYDIVKTFNQLKENPLLSLLVTLTSIVVSSGFIKVLIDKHFNHSNIKAYREGLELPEKLKPIK